MTIIEIESLSNGAHRNQSGNMRKIPTGWAVIPDGMSIPASFPFVDITVENGVVKSINGAEVPETEPEPKPEHTAQDDVDAMIVDHEYRLTLIELGVTE